MYRRATYLLFELMFIAIAASAANAASVAPPNVSKPDISLSSVKFSLGVGTGYYSGLASRLGTVDLTELRATAQASFGDLSARLSLPYELQVRAPGSNSNRSGLGDAWLRLEYRWRDTNQDLTYLPYFRVKIPTGDRTFGLTTSYADYEIGAGVAKDISRDWRLLGHLGYRLSGSAAGAATRRDLTYDLSVRYALDRRNQFLAGLGGRQYSFAGAAPTTTATVSWNYLLSPNCSLQTYLQTGISGSGPKLGAGVNVLFNIK